MSIIKNVYTFCSTIPDKVYKGVIPQATEEDYFQYIHEGSTKKAPILWDSKGYKYTRKVSKFCRIKKAIDC